MKHIKLGVIILILSALNIVNIYAQDSNMVTDKYVESYDGNRIDFKNGIYVDEDYADLITKYIREYFDENFCISQYDIAEREYEANDLGDIVRYINLQYKIGDFLCEGISYQIYITNNELDYITRYGKAVYDIEIKELEKIDEEGFKKYAYDEALKGYEGYFDIKEQEITKMVNLSVEKAFFYVYTTYENEDGVTRVGIDKYKFNAEFISTDESKIKINPEEVPYWNLIKISEEKINENKESIIKSKYSLKSDGVSFNGLECYKYDGFVYCRLRDLAKVLNLEMSYSNNVLEIKKLETYYKDLAEFKNKNNYNSSIYKIIFIEKSLNEEKEICALNINGYNYFKLRDITNLLNYIYQWDESNNLITINK